MVLKKKEINTVKNDSLPIHFPRCYTHFVQFKVEELTKLRYFFQLFSLSQRFWLAEKLRSHVTITLRDKSRYDLIVEMSQSFVGDHVWNT